MSSSSDSSQDTGYFSNTNKPRKPIPGLNQEKQILFMDKVIDWLNLYKIEGCPLPREPRPRPKSEAEIEERLQLVAPWAKEMVRHSFSYKYEFIDTHYRMEHILFCSDKAKVKKMKEEFFTSPVNMAGYITVFTHPRLYSLIDSSIPFPNFSSKGTCTVMGCPPKIAHVFQSCHLVDLRNALHAKNAIALGPCGLDLRLSTHQEVQRSVFKSQIQLAAEMAVPIVVQCNWANSECLDMLLRYAPSWQKIHLQGFQGDKNQATIWTSSFPNVFFGLTPVIGEEATPTSVKDMVKSIPMNRILLESGAPHFVPARFKENISCSHFGFALFTAQGVGQLRRINVDTVLRICRENTDNFYSV